RCDQGAFPDRARTPVPRRKRRGALRVRTRARHARGARPEEPRGRQRHRAHGRALHAVGREASRSRRPRGTRTCDREWAAQPPEGPAARGEVVPRAEAAQADRCRLGGSARDGEGSALDRGGARTSPRGLPVSRRRGLRLRRARQLPRVVRAQPTPAADREVPSGQRRADRHAQHDRGLSTRPRRLPRSDRTRDRRARSRARDREAASGRRFVADGDSGTPPRRRFRRSARERRSARAVPANRKSARDAGARRGRRGGDGHARREEFPRAADRRRSEPDRYRDLRLRVRVLRDEGKRVELSRHTERRLSQGPRRSGPLRTARGARRGTLADRGSALRRTHRGGRRAHRPRAGTRAPDPGRRRPGDAARRAREGREARFRRDPGVRDAPSRLRARGRARRPRARSRRARPRGASPGVRRGEGDRRASRSGRTSQRGGGRGGRDLRAPPILPRIETRSFARRLPIDLLVVVGLFALQAWAIAPLFTGEFTQFRGSIEATFIANARFIADRFPDLSWYPYWYLGFPFELFYTPLLPAVVAVLGKIGGDIPQAYRIVAASGYALGLPALYLAARELTGSRRAALLSAGAFLLLPSLTYVFAPIRSDGSGLSGTLVPPPWRLVALVEYGEGPHVLSLSLALLGVAATLRYLRAPSAFRLAVAVVALVAVALPLVALAAVIAVAALPLKRLPPGMDVVVLWLLVLGAIVALKQLFAIGIAPQPIRYSLELDAAFAIGIGIVVAALIERLTSQGIARGALGAVALVAFVVVGAPAWLGVQPRLAPDANWRDWSERRVALWLAGNM